MDISYVIFNEILCNEQFTINDCDIPPFSTLYVCPDLYELNVHLPDESSITIFKPYYTLFPSFLEEVAVKILSTFKV